jgi:hypothetical protein
LRIADWPQINTDAHRFFSVIICVHLWLGLRIADCRLRIADCGFKRLARNAGHPGTCPSHGQRR